MIIVFLGLQGAGKGVFSRKLSKDFKFSLVNTGDLLRKSKDVRKYVDKGVEVPDKIVFDIIKKKIKKKVIIEGFPRTLEQVKLLGKVDKVIYIKISDKIGIKRLLGRRICSKCNQVYNIETLKPKVKGKCDVCGSELIKRKDDTLKLIKKRMAWSKRDLEPVVKAYRKMGVLEEVDGESSVDVVYERIRKLFK